MDEIYSFETAARKIRDTVKRKTLSPGSQADLGVDRPDRCDQSVNLFFFSPKCSQHRTEFEKIDVKKNTDIIEDYIRETAGSDPSVVSHKETASHRKPSHGLTRFLHLSSLSVIERKWLCKKNPRALQKSQHITECEEVGLDRSFGTEIGDHIQGEAPQKTAESHRRTYEHDPEGNRRQDQSRKIGGNAPVFKTVQEIEIVVDRIPGGAAKTLQDPLDIQAYLFICCPPLHSLFTEVSSAVCAGRAKQPVEVFLSGRAAGRVHTAIEKIHIQIIPGDVIDLKILSVPHAVPGDLLISSIRILLGTWLSEVFFELFPLSGIKSFSVA